MLQACPACSLQYDVSAYNEGTRFRCKCTAILTVTAHQARRVACASCGASVPGDAHICPYCKGAVQRGVCPKCFHALRKDAKFCDDCGESIRAQVIKPPEATDHNCPRCDGTLFHVQLEGYAVDQCSGCAGLWIDRPTVEAIMKDRPQDLETGVRPDLQTGSADQVGLLTGEFKGRAYIPCPHCSKLMTPQNYAKYSGVIVDLCKDHGIWFDAGELNRILQFVSQGGLVEARKKETQRAKEEARDARFDATVSAAQQANRGYQVAGAYGGRTTPVATHALLDLVVEGVFGIFGR